MQERHLCRYEFFCIVFTKAVDERVSGQMSRKKSELNLWRLGLDGADKAGR